ncbi:helix-turn-helix domain-containing protein [Streptomyces sp. NPDC004327]|uniref:helix-turn-helix domain-containing protein n=1 Tax=Streptomyces sp. NPDC004327 TaxID=3364699 RepID=UPI00369A03A7
MEAADGFAELMRALKERSGLSYGTLAKRLHVSTSTLHRYCNGDAVPTEFAPVERLGRLCGATREELVELHRAWILADEARRRGKGEPESEPEAGSEAGAEAGAGPAAERVAEAAVAPGEASEAAGVAEVGEGAGAPGAEAGAGAGGVRAPGAAAGAVGAGPVVDAAPATGGVPRSRKRLVVLLAAVAVVGLAVPAVYVAGRADDRGAGAAGAGADTGPPAPLSVGISSYNWDEPCGQYYVLGQQPGHVPPPPTPQDTRGWARALGGTDGGHLRVQLTVTGSTQAPVVLTGLHVRVAQRAEPLAGSVFSMGDGCGSGITPQTFDADLDAPRPYLKPVAGQDGDRVVPAKDFPYKVSAGDPQVLNLDVHTEQYATSWYLELAWSSGEQHGTVRVDDGGQLFRTTAIAGRPTYGYWPDEGTWVKQE